MKKYWLLGFVIVFSFVLFGCSTTVQRIDTSTIKDLSGRWNDADAQLVAEQIVDDMLNGPWLKKYLKNQGREPRVIVGTIKNKTDEHIDVDVFRKDIEKELTNSGEVVFVASKEEREEMRDERTDMQEYSSDATKKKFKQELAADFMMKGVLTSIIDEKGGEKVVYYQCDMELFDLETNAKVWVGQKKIKKYISKPGLGF
ncbi:MAG: penicillin-binding protein activator LpoB [Candidatus Goldbacteria bacterium]|nr:penicillin-binding protein activator LpoB [Candidatus Goldiibacteriota bacterium]HPD18517.1 penicillin-binding protein activator LpoB [Candidatus Goldiibacteriota bacterium]